MNINTGKKVKAQKIVIYGVEGIGKTEIASHFPSPLFIDTEGSTDHLDVSRTDTPTSWPMLMEQIYWIANNQHNFKTLVLDTIDWAERLAIKHICANGRVNGIEDFGWGKGFTYVAEEIGRFLDALSHVADRGINVLILAHTHQKTINPPEESGPYDKYELRMEKKSAPLPKEWADAVFFVNYKLFLTGDTSGKKKATGGRRTLYTAHTAAYDAKNRYGLPKEIDFEGDSSKIYQILSPFIPILNSSAPAQSAQAQQQPPKQEEVLTSEVQAQTEAPKQKEVSATEEIETPVDGKGSTAFCGPLYDLMKQSNVTDEDIEALAVRSGHFPQNMKFGDFPQDYLDHLVASWSSVLESIQKHKNQ